MKRLKFLLLTVVCVAVFLCVATVTASADVIASGSCGTNVTYTLDDEGTLVLSGYGDMYDNVTWDNRELIKNVQIEEGVKSIGNAAFAYCTNLLNVSFPCSLKRINIWAFGACSNLTDIIFPENIEFIGESAFTLCESITKVNFPEGVTFVADGLFLGCSNLETVKILGNVESIGVQAFSGTAIKEIVLPNSVTSLGQAAFEFCKNLANINIPEGIKSIPSNCFSWTESLKTIDLPNTLERIEPWAFCEGTGLESIVIPSNVNYIGDDAFDGCSQLKEITIENKGCQIYNGSGTIPCTSTIYGYANSFANVYAKFYGRNFISLDESESKIVEAGFINDYMVWALDNNGTLTISGTGKMKNFQQASSAPWHQFRGSIKKVIISDGVTTISMSAFYGCSNLQSVTIGDDVASIGNYAFYNCINLQNVSIGDSVTSIGEFAFTNCNRLQNVVVPDSVTKIEMGTFSDCSSLQSVTIGSGITSIGYSAFNNCNKIQQIHIKDLTKWFSINFGDYYSNPLSICADLYLNGEKVTDITIPSEVIEIGTQLRGCTSLVNVIIPDTVTSIASDAFYDCSNIQSVTIGNGVTSIGDYAFLYCSNLESITIGNNVTSIGIGAFKTCDEIQNVYIKDLTKWFTINFGDYYSNPLYNCAILYLNGVEVTDITIPSDITTIGTQLRGCISLTNIIIPDSIISIGNFAFDGCSNLQSITIGDGVTNIGDYTFANCSNLQGIFIGNAVTNIGNSAFWDCSSLQWVIIPDSVKSIARCAFHGCNNLSAVGYTKDVYSKENIKIDAYNEELQNAIWYYNSCKTEHQYSSLCDANCNICDFPRTVKVSHTYSNGCDSICNRCDFVRTDISHNNTKNVAEVKATCTTKGSTAGVYCNDCAKYISGHTEIPVDANAHKWDNGSIATTATCKVSGVKTYTCQHNASHKKTEDLGLNGSNHVNTKNVAEVKATCTTKGSTAGVYCNDCQKYISGHVEIAINASNHVNTKNVPETPATFENVGYTAGVYCNDCKKYISGHTEIPKLVPEFTDSKDAKENGSNIVSNNGLTVAQLLSQAGKGAVIKTTDGKSVENAALIGTGMVLTMADGSKKEIVVYGDVDGDGKISAADARQALRASVGLENFKEDSAKYKAAKRGSVDKLSAADARLILRASVGLEDPKAWMK